MTPRRRLVSRPLFALGVFLSLTVSTAATALQAERAGSANASAKPMDAADSSQLARLSYRAAGDRLRKGDTAAALSFLDSASRHWPYQPAYPQVLLELAALFRDTAMVKSALTYGVNLHLGFSAATSPSLGGFARSDTVRLLLRRHATLSEPLARSRPLHTLPDSMLFPEGIASDPRSGLLYVSSIHRRTIISVAATGGVRPFLRDSVQGAVFGLVVDTARNLLWATTKPHPSMAGWRSGASTRAALLAVDLTSGRIVRRIAFPERDTLAHPGDLALSAHGEILVSDATVPVLWRLRAGADTMARLTHHLFRSLQGVVPSADGRIAWVADYAHGLLRVSLDSGTVVRVADLPGQTMVGIDGMVGVGRSLVGVQNGVTPARIVRLDLDATGARLIQLTVLDRNPLATSPTTCTVVGGSLVFVANSLWEMLDQRDMIRTDVRLPRPLLLQLPLDFRPVSPK